MDSCNVPAKYTPMIINISLHVMILFGILSCLFYFLISKVETSTINNQITDSIDNIVSTLSQNPNITPYLQGDVQTSIAGKLKQSFVYPDQNVVLNNKWLFNTVIIANASMAIIVISLILILLYNCNECIPIKHIILENIGTFTLVGVIEILFFLNVAIKYVPVHPDVVSTTFLSQMSKNLQ